MPSKYLSIVKMLFPNVQPVDDDNWSDPSNDYNCIAWAAENTLEWWWPVGGSPFKPSHWPAGIPNVVSIPAFVQAFRTLGYVECDNRDYEMGFKKVAIYATLDQPRKPKHMARQLPGGAWTSKLGPGPDIIHATLECIEGHQYGNVAIIMRKPDGPNTA